MHGPVPSLSDNHERTNFAELSCWQYQRICEQMLNSRSIIKPRNPTRRQRTPDQYLHHHNPMELRMPKSPPPTPDVVN